MTDGKKLVIFICTGNTCRSPMAEALFKKYLIEHGVHDIKAASRGLAAAGGEPASRHAVQVMLEHNCDISAHRALPLTDGDLAADLFVCMTEGHAAALIRCNIASEKIYVMNIPDPYGGTLDDYRLCALKIESEMSNVYARVK